MKIDDFLNRHLRPPFDAVLEPVPDNPTLVKVTPVASGSECACHRSFIIDKAQILDVDMTDRSLACCGKMHVVARVRLDDDARVSAHAVVASIIAEHVRESTERGGSDDPRACQEEAIRHYKGCVGSCRRSPDPDACREECRNRLSDDLKVCYNNW